MRRGSRDCDVARLFRDRLHSLRKVVILSFRGRCGDLRRHDFGVFRKPVKPVLLSSQNGKYYLAGRVGASLAVFGVTTTGSFPADSTTCWAR